MHSEDGEEDLKIANYYGPDHPASAGILFAWRDHLVHVRGGGRVCLTQGVGPDPPYGHW